MKVLSRVVRLPYAPILLASLALLAPVFLTGKALFWGTPLLQFVPWWKQAWESLLSGHLPLWNPLVGMGAPLLANYQSALLYPPHWVYLLLYVLGGVPLMAWGQALLVALHLAWAGFGMALLARRLGLGLLAMTVSGLAFGLCGYLVSRAGFLSINAAVAWLPWVIWSLTPHPSGRYLALKRFLVFLICLSFQLLAGHAQIAWYTLLLGGIWLSFWAWNTGREGTGFGNRETEPNRRDWLKAVNRVFLAWGWLALAVLLAVCMVAAQLLPTAEYLSQSQRSEAVDYEYAMNYSFWPWHLITLVAPDMFGSPAEGDYWGYSNYWEDAIYVGLLPVLLALGALLGSLRRGIRELSQPQHHAGGQLMVFRPRFAGFLFFVFVLGLSLALGRFTPLFPWLYEHIPTFDMFQAPARYLIWTQFSLALLAGLGAERWRRPEGRGLYWTRLGTAGAFAVSLGAGLAWYFMGDISPSFIRATALAGFWGLGSGLLSLVAPERLPGEIPIGVGNSDDKWNAVGLWRWGVAAFVAADLIVAGWGLNPGVDLAVYGASPTGEQVRGLLDNHRLYLPEVDHEFLKFDRYLRFDDFDPGVEWLGLRAAMLPNTNLLDDISMVNNFDPLVPGRYARWMGNLPQAGLEVQGRMLRLMDVGAVEIIDVNEPYGVRFLPYQGGARLRWVPCARSVKDGEEAWEQLLRDEVDYGSEVILEGLESSSPTVCVGQAGVGAEARASIEYESSNRIVVQLEAPSAGWLLLSDIWYPGWRARVDGSTVPVLRANYLFRAVQVGAGEQQVVFVYRPISFWVGLALSLATWIALVLVWIKIVRR